MLAWPGRRRYGWRQAVWLMPVAGALWWSAAAGERSERVALLPRVRNGETLVYESRARIDRHVQTQSNVATILRPGEARHELANILRLSVQEARLVDNKLLLAGETTLQPAGTADGEAATGAGKSLKVSFTIGGDGGITRAEGLEELEPEQVLAWQFWVAQFAFGWTLPSGGVRPGEKWKSEETEKTPTPIANLAWKRETTYVQNDKCPILQEQQCAVFLITSTLKQKSSAKDATPEDYRIRELRTFGTAKGTNETVAYISLQSGLLVRATEDLQQSMAVTIAKADGSNGVHYDIEVKSHFETALVKSAGK